MDVLDFDGGLVDQDANGQSQPAQGHDVDRVACQIQNDDRSQERQRDVENHDDHGPQVAQEQEHHQPGQAGSQGAFDTHALDGSIDDRRLVELVGDLDVVGQGRLEPRQVLLDRVDHRQRRGGSLLDHRQVDRLASVDQSIANGDVGRVGNGADVTNVDVLPQFERDVAQRLRAYDHGIGRYDGHLVLDRHIAGGADEVAAVDRIHDVLGREVVGAEPVGVDVDDDRPDVAAERRRRRDPRQPGEHRPYPEQSQVLELADRAPLTLEDQVAHRQAARVEPDQERRQ